MSSNSYPRYGTRRWDRVVLSLMRKRRLVQRLEDDLHLLVKQPAIGLVVTERRVEHFDLPRVIPASYPEYHPPARHVVGHRVVFRKPQRVPHGSDIEPATELDPLRQVTQVHGEHENVRNALVTLPLEVVLSQPHRIETAVVESLGNSLCLLEYARQPFVREPTIVDRKSVEADVVQIDVSCEETPELGNHCDTSIETAL